MALGGDAIQALLAAPALAKTAHFVLQAAPKPVAPELPTEAAPDRTDSVDNLETPPSEPMGLALVVPKRHVRRAVTRNLVKRQMREAVQRHRGQWPGRQLLVRQRAAFDRRQFPSAASAALRVAVRDELERLFAQAAAR